MQSGLNRSYGM